MVTKSPGMHSMDLKVLAHVDGVSEAFQAVEDAMRALEVAKRAIMDVTVELDIE